MNDKNKKSETIRLQIQKVKADNPSPDFTAVIMKTITESENEVAGHSLLKSLLRTHGMEKSPDGFVRSVMAKVKAHEFKPAFKPVISRRTWIMVGLAATFLTILQVFSNQTATSHLGLTSYAVYFGNKLTSIFASVPSLYLITFFAISALVLVDYLLNRRSNAANNLG